MEFSTEQLNGLGETLQVAPRKPRMHFGKKLLIAVLAMVFFISLTIYFGGKMYASAFEERVYPGVKLGSFEIGGMTRMELKNFIETLNNRYANEGIDIVVENSLKKPNQAKFTTLVGVETAVEAVKIDSESITNAAIKFGKEGTELTKIVYPLWLRYENYTIPTDIIINGLVLRDAIRSTLSGFEEPYQNAGLRNINVFIGSAGIIPEKSGLSFDYSRVSEKILEKIRNLSFETVSVSMEKFSPSISSEDIETVLPRLGDMFKYGTIKLVNESTVNTTSPTTTEWTLTNNDFADLLEVKRNDAGLYFSLNFEKTVDYLRENVLPSVEIPSEDAKFAIENNKVVEFKPSRDGVTLDIESTFAKLTGVFEQRNTGFVTSSNVIPIDVKVKLADMQTTDINNFGIVEIIGSGSSTFKDSHSRRIKNIAHAVERLNGTLISPGEIFSAIKYAGPFTAENGYLPEAVIKGREIVDEIGGGMCQIGTTLFRMAMQSGMEITERRNHSLAISYYADPVNGNPGTDATLYEPYLDLKFRNDTGNYLLLKTSIDYKKQQLIFTLWGTKDGRSGSYTRPLVSKWIPPPKEVEYIVSNKLKPGEERCQPAYRGAVASFTYSRVTPEGEKIDKVYESFYRALPKICTVGPTTTPETAEIF